MRSRDSNTNPNNLHSGLIRNINFGQALMKLISNLKICLFFNFNNFSLIYQEA